MFFRPIVKHTVTYIVAAVIINERGEVLMMQVSKMRDYPNTRAQRSL